MPSVAGQTGAGGNIGYTVGRTVKNPDDPKDSHLKKLEFGHESPDNAIVKVICTGPPSPDFSRPYQREEDHTYFSSGFIVRERRVLTCAHSVDRHTVVKLRKLNSSRRYPARVLAVALDCDIAILTVDDTEFWKGAKVLEFGDMPAPGAEVIIVGYPRGSGNVCKLLGNVKSVGMMTYLHWGTKFLALKVNVAMAEGYSGGPVVNQRGECVGMSFQNSETTGSVIPPSLIEHVMQDYDKNGAYTGFPILAVRWQKMENCALRMSRDMGHDQHGVLIVDVKPNRPESELLKTNDVILSIDGICIDNNGTVPFLWGQRIEFGYLLTQKSMGDDVVLEVIRDSKTHTFNIRLTTHKQFKTANVTGRPLPYYIVAGFVFTTLSFRYLKSAHKEKFTYLGEEELSQASYEERVVVCEVLKADINIGYSRKGIVQSQVLTFNDEPVQNLQSLASMVEKCDEKFLEFILENQKKLVVETEHARYTTPGILETYGIPSAMSDDLKEKSIVAEEAGPHERKPEQSWIRTLDYMTEYGSRNAYGLGCSTDMETYGELTWGREEVSY